MVSAVIDHLNHKVIDVIPTITGNYTSVQNDGNGFAEMISTEPIKLEIGQQVTLSNSANHPGIHTIIKVADLSFTIDDVFIITETGDFTTALLKEIDVKWFSEDIIISIGKKKTNFPKIGAVIVIDWELTDASIVEYSRNAGDGVKAKWFPLNEGEPTQVGSRYIRFSEFAVINFRSKTSSTLCYASVAQV